MDELENGTQSFIIKLWIEETVTDTGQALWRGHITHVPSGERRYLKDLNEIASFITPYLEKAGTRFKVC